jgi:hypothetical protein
MIVFVIGRFITVITRGENTLSQASFNRDLKEYGSLRIDYDDIMFQMIDSELDIHDNPYVTFSMAMVKKEEGQAAE